MPTQQFSLCPICHGSLAKYERDAPRLTRHECPTCGDFFTHPDGATELIDELWQEGQRREIGMISAFLREKKIRGQAPVHLAKDKSKWKESTGIVVTVADAINAFPATFSERINRMLLNLHVLSSRLGAEVPVRSNFDYPLAYCQDVSEFEYMLETLRDMHLLKLTPGSMAQITPEGWSRIDRIQSLRPATSTQAFVAMWFHSSTDDAWSSGLEPGVKSAGYTPLRIDKKEFLEDIHDEALAGIRRSRFVISDLTGQRQSVYFEAGFAEGLGIPVIYTRDQKETEKDHFDIRQRPIITWKSSEDLRARLEQRIRALFGEARTPTS